MCVLCSFLCQNGLVRQRQSIVPDSDDISISLNSFIYSVEQTGAEILSPQMQHWALNTVVIVKNKPLAKALKQMILILPWDMILSPLTTSATLQRRRARVRSLPTRTAVRLLPLNANIWLCWRFAHLQLARTTRFPFHADGNLHNASLPPPRACSLPLRISNRFTPQQRGFEWSRSGLLPVLSVGLWEHLRKCPREHIEEWTPIHIS